MDSEFKVFGFEKYLFVKKRRSIADSFSKTNRCGIYILHFTNDEYYVGLATDVVKRYDQHRKSYDDIEYLSFKEVTKKNLVATEIEIVYKLEGLNKALRNINIVSTVIGDTDLDLVVSKEDQDKWINYELPFESLTTERFEYPELRKKYTAKFNKLKQNSLFETCCEILQNYIYYTTPYPRKTEYSFWSCSCLPSGGGSILARINIYWQETLCLYEEDFVFTDNNGTESLEKGVLVSVILSKTTLFKKYNEELLLQKYHTLSFGDALYPSGGQDQQQILIAENEFLDLLYDKPISDAIKELNLRLMRKGGCIFNRYHCFDLADEAVRTDNLQDV